MAILDYLLRFWVNQALTASEESDANGSVIDLGTTGRDIAGGEPMAVFFAIVGKLTATDGLGADYTTGNETYQFRVLNSAAADLGTPTYVVSSQAFTGDLLTNGKIVVMPLPQGVIDKRYLGVDLVSAGTTPQVMVTSYLAPLSHIAGKQVIYARNDNPPSF